MKSTLDELITFKSCMLHMDSIEHVKHKLTSRKRDSVSAADFTYVKVQWKILSIYSCIVKYFGSYGVYSATFLGANWAIPFNL